MKTEWDQAKFSSLVYRFGAVLQTDMTLKGLIKLKLNSTPFNQMVVVMMVVGGGCYGGLCVDIGGRCNHGKITKIRSLVGILNDPL